jgi:uncharacterized metal-binding protein YceD (DUF177 family)
MIIPLHTLAKEPQTLHLEADSAEAPDLRDAGVAGSMRADLDVIPLAGDSYLVQGKAEGLLDVECGRCLEPFKQPFSLKFNLLMDRKDSTGLEWVEDEDQGVEDYQVRLGPDVTEVPLDAMIAEQVLLNYNLHPLPDLDEAGRCTQCGRPAFSVEEPKKTEGVDPRWAKLENLKGTSDADGPKKPGKG